MLRKVIFISGEICSGKDTIMRNEYLGDQYQQIDLGHLVREKFQTADRIFDNDLEPYFVKRVLDITKNNDKTYVITGLRQPSLAVKLSELFDVVEHTYLVVPREILKRRYYGREDVKDKNISFVDAIRGDQSLGMKELQSYLLTEVECNFINNY